MPREFKPSELIVLREYTFVTEWEELGKVWVTRCYELPACLGEGDAIFDSLSDSMQAVLDHLEYRKKLGV